MQTNYQYNSKRILIVDNDPDFLDMLTECLNNEGMDVKTSACPNDIFQLIRDFEPDLIILDYLLDGINGGELCYQVKSSVQGCEIPVIIISAYPRVLLSLGTYGCDLFIPKPFDLHTVIGHIKNLLLTNPISSLRDQLNFHLSKNN
ncbi:MAG: hypothetical protein JWP45_1250 [Mucilaginibacter sp.]|nr:hypothetical protein [Mucilaginibacter sp.]